MPVPTHGPRCKTLFCKAVTCQYCNTNVYHWSCSCGSNLLFDKLGRPWPQHPCSKAGRPVNVKPLKTYTYGVSSVVCLKCGNTVRKREMDAHNYYTHGLGSPPPGAQVSGKSSAGRRPKAKSKKQAKVKRVVCKVCKQSVRESRLEKHMLKAHPTRLHGKSTPVDLKKVSGERPSPQGPEPMEVAKELEERKQRISDASATPPGSKDLAPEVLCEAVSRRVREAGSIEREVLLHDVASELSLPMGPSVRSRLANAVDALILINLVYSDGELVWRSGVDRKPPDSKNLDASTEVRKLPPEKTNTQPRRPVDFSADVLAALYQCIPESKQIRWRTLIHKTAEYLGLRKLKLKRHTRERINKILHDEIVAGRLETDWVRVWRPRKRHEE